MMTKEEATFLALTSWGFDELQANKLMHFKKRVTIKNKEKEDNYQKHLNFLKYAYDNGRFKNG